VLGTRDAPNSNAPGGNCERGEATNRRTRWNRMRYRADRNERAAGDIESVGPRKTVGSKRERLPCNEGQTSKDEASDCETSGA
jgi:hypothetical protein